MSKTNPVFLPEEPKDGCIGYYPVKPEEWGNLPLPLRASTSHPIAGKGHVSAVIFDCWHDTLKVRMTVEIHPQNVFKALFTLNGAPLLYSVVGVRWADGSKSFAKWYQDNRTGAYCIVTGGGSPVLKQGGYSDHMPANVYYDENCQRYMLQYAPNTVCYSSLT